MSGFTYDGKPSFRSFGASADIRQNFLAIENALSRMPPPAAGNVRGFFGGTFDLPTILNPVLVGGTLGTAAAPVKGHVSQWLSLAPPVGTIAPSVPANTFGVGSVRSNVWTVEAFNRTAITVNLSGDAAIGDPNRVPNNATSGFARLPQMLGPPTGTPAVLGSSIPCVVDTVNSRLYMYVNSTWRYATLT